MSDPFVRFLEHHGPRPSYCGAAAAVTFCVASLAAAAVGTFFGVTRILDHFLPPRRTP